MEIELLDPLERLFQDAIARRPEDRQAFLDGECDGDPALRREVESLIDADEDAESGGFLEGCAWPGMVVPNSAGRGLVAPLSGNLGVPGFGRGSPTGPRDEGRCTGLGTADPSIEGYKLVGLLGRGGMGVVYRAYDRRRNRIVALKLLPLLLSSRESAKVRFLREARIASALDHPNICKIYDTGVTGSGQLFIVMACYEGETLRQKIDRGRLRIADALDHAHQIARGLAYAHAVGVIHCDVKPDNVFVTRKGRVKILDFGVAKSAGTASLSTGSAIGTMAYMSPEEIRGCPTTDASDLWGLSVVLFEMLTGQRPFRVRTGRPELQSVLDHPARIRHTWRELSGPLHALLARALDENPDRRFRSAREMRDVLLRVREAVGTARSGRGTPGNEQGRRPPRRDALGLP